MKKLITIIPIALISFFSCTNEVTILDNDEGSTVLTGGVKASVDGQEYISTTATATVNTITDEVNNTTNNTIIINATNSAGESFLIRYDTQSFVTATYTQNTANAFFNYIANGATYTADANTAGSSFTLNVTNIDTGGQTLQGTFDAVLVNPNDATDTKTITNGEFTGVVYTQSIETNHNVTGTFTVNIDGTLNTLTNISLYEDQQGFTLTGLAGAQALILNFPANPNIGSNNITETGEYKASYITNATTGNLDFVSFDATNMSGSFAFDVDNAGTTVSLTAGTFALTY